MMPPSKVFALLLLGGVALAAPQPAAGQRVPEGTELSGPASVIDGDNIQIGGRAFRLAGIDAPEIGQTCLNKRHRWRCGYQAALALRKLATLSPVRCVAMRDDGVEVTGRCSAGDRDLAAVMLTNGYAVALADAPEAYVKAQSAAKTGRLGIWRGEFVEPAQWRAGVRLSDGSEDPVQVCDIKGTINAGGQRVYYVPTEKGFDGATVDPDRGERFFCSDDEARLAGWRNFPK